MWICYICDKAFTKESSHRRHIPYCRRTQTRPRVRPRSCRPCNAAKVKCTFQVPCRRCATRGLDCVYERPSSTVAATHGGEAALSNVDSQAFIDLPGFDTSLQGFDASNLDFSIKEDLRVADAFEPPNLLGTVGNAIVEARDMSAVLATPPADEALFDTWASPHAFIQPRLGQAAQAPWSMWTTRVTTNSTTSARKPDDVLLHPRIACLALLQPPNLVVEHTIQLVVQSLKAYPLMMLRRETFPPFIHPHWHRQSTPSLPEPLSNCMSIAQMYAFRSEETKPFLWRVVKAEGERLQNNRESLSPQDLLAAIQAHVIYIIMRAVDGSSYIVGLNQQLLITYKYLCKQFGKRSEGSFCEVDEFFPLQSWEDWIFAESRRRTACLFYLICRCVSVDTGYPDCDLFERFRELPIACPKTLWEAKTRADWDSEYSTYSSLRQTGFHTMGMLIEAHEQKDDPVKSQLLDYWHSRADNLGNLLNIVASITWVV